MTNISRRRLARFAVDELLAGKPVDKVAQQLAAMLVLTKREKQADLLASDIAWELENRGKLSSVNVTSVTPLTDSLREQIINFIKKSAQVDQAVLKEQVDKSVLGGVHIETPNHSWDKTVKGALMNIREAF